MTMRFTMRWLLPITALLLLLCVPIARVQAQSKPSAQNRSHSTASRRSTSHPSHPMRNAKPKRHAVSSRVTPLISVRYLQPQQASASSSGSSGSSKTSPASAKSSAKTTSASSKKKKSSKKSRHSKREPFQKAPTPERITEIQSSLARGGYYEGDPNGKWDANTIAAMQKFQSANGLDPSGKLDASSLQKLGLGSGIAGVSAPKPATLAPSAPAKPIAEQPSAATTSAASTSASNSSPAASSTSDPKPQK